MYSHSDPMECYTTLTRMQLPVYMAYHTRTLEQVALYKRSEASIMGLP